jgi:hypothetical protein
LGVLLDYRLLSRWNAIQMVGFRPRAHGGGRFHVPEVRAGKVQLRVEAKGFAPAEFSVDVTGNHQTIDVVLGELR